MPDFTTSKRLFEMLVLPLVTLLAKAVPTHNSDYHCHKFNTQHHFFLGIFAQLTRAESSIALLEELNDTECNNQQRNLRQLIGFNAISFAQPVTLNQSSFSRANTTRDWRVWRYCFHQLLATARKHCAKPQLKGLERVLSIDGSLFDCLDRMIWASYASTTNKVKGHFFFDLDGLPDKMVLTTGKASEREILATHFTAGFTYVFDRGYKDYTLFKDMVSAKAHFVTRLMSNANYKAAQRRPISKEQAGLGVVSDELIKLGRHSSTALTHIRLVTFKDSQGKIWRYITSRDDLEPIMIVELYLRRWDIEFFFRWIKRHLQVKHWYSRCENGVLIQLYTALITFLLLKLYTAFSEVAGFKQMNIDFVRWIQRHLFGQVAPNQVLDYFVMLGLDTTLLQT